MSDTPAIPLIDGADVVVVGGPGGVGKTTTAAVLAREAARAGRKVVVVTIDPARRLADALGLSGGLTGSPQRIGLDGDGELWAMMLDTPAMFERVVRANALDEEQAERVISNRFYVNIAGALSGTQEYMASEALHELHRDERFDLVIVDTPPSRNALDFLEAPGVLARFLGHPVFRLMMLPSRTGARIVGFASQPVLKAIGRVVGSDVLADAVAFFQAFTGMEAGFRRRAEEVTGLLQAPTTRFVVVTAPQAEPVAEAVWFAGQLDQHGLGVSEVIVNRAMPSFGSGTAEDAAALADRAGGRTAEAAIWRNLADLRRRVDAETEVVRPLVGSRPVRRIPLLDGDVHDAEALDRLGRFFAPPPS